LVVKIRNTKTYTTVCRYIILFSRQSWAYVLTKSKKKKRAEVSVKTIQEFKDEVGLIRGLEGDNEFSSAPIKKFCDDNDIRLDTSVAKEEHISNGNKLGIIDRLVRTLRELIEKYYDITGNRTDNIKDVMKSIIDTYNNNSHRTLDNKTPNQVFKDNDDQITRHLNDSVHNQQVYKTVPFDTGDKVRILEEKGKFDKGKQKFSKEVYTIEKKEGYKLIIKDEKRKLKPSELLKTTTVSNPISQAYIDRTIKSKEIAKITNKLIRNEEMTKEEAIKAKKQLKDNSLPPALSTRSNDRKLRK